MTFGVAARAVGAARAGVRASIHGASAGLRALRALVVPAVGFLSVVTAWAQAVPPLPFVEPGGVIRMELHYSHMLGALGEPQKTRLRAPAGEGDLRGGIVYEYPELGLGFVVDHAERQKPDPRIARMQVRPPAPWRTHEGLAIGMNLGQAQPIVAATWKERSTSNQGLIHSIGVADARAGGTREAWLRFVADQGLVLMEFEASTRPEPPKRMSRKTRELVNLLVLLVIAVGLTWLFKRLGIPLPGNWGQRQKPQSTPARDGLGLLLALGGGALAAAGFSGMGSGDGYARMGSFMLLLMGFAGLMLAMMVWATSARRGLRWIGLGVFLLVIGASLVAKLVR